MRVVDCGFGGFVVSFDALCLDLRVCFVRLMLLWVLDVVCDLVMVCCAAWCFVCLYVYCMLSSYMMFLVSVITLNCLRVLGVFCWVCCICVVRSWWTLVKLVVWIS